MTTAAAHHRYCPNCRAPLTAIDVDGSVHFTQTWNRSANGHWIGDPPEYHEVEHAAASCPRCYQMLDSNVGDLADLGDAHPRETDQ